MTQEEKRRFDEMAEMDKSRHIKKNDEFVTHDTAKKIKRKRIKNPNEPKRAWSAFFFYCNEFRSEIKDAHPDWRIGDVAKELGKRWEICLDKGKYEKLSKTDKERYVKVAWVLSCDLPWFQDMESFKAGAYVPVKIAKVKESVPHNETTHWDDVLEIIFRW